MVTERDYPGLLDAIHQLLRDRDPGHAWRASVGDVVSPSGQLTAALRLDRTGPAEQPGFLFGVPEAAELEAMGPTAIVDLAEVFVQGALRAADQLDNMTRDVPPIPRAEPPTTGQSARFRYGRTLGDRTIYCDDVLIGTVDPGWGPYVAEALNRLDAEWRMLPTWPASSAAQAVAVRPLGISEATAEWAEARGMTVAPACTCTIALGYEDPHCPVHGDPV